MNSDRNNEELNSGDFDAPAKLAEAFAKLQPKSVFVPPSVDRAVIIAAKNHLAKPKVKTSWSWRIFWSAATAPVLVGLLCILLVRNSRQPDYAREDLNRDGHVDILDALHLARELNSGEIAGDEFDLNGDGAVDERDADFIAARSVKLEKGGRS